MSTTTIDRPAIRPVSNPVYHAASSPVLCTAGRPVAPRGGVRLTRRGRVVVLVLALVAVLAAGVFLGGSSVATDRPGTPPPTRAVVVTPGQTLWDIAGGIAEDGDVRAMVYRIEELNGLASGTVYAGQRIVVPVD